MTGDLWGFYRRPAEVTQALKANPRLFDGGR